MVRRRALALAPLWLCPLLTLPALAQDTIAVPVQVSVIDASGHALAGASVLLSVPAAGGVGSGQVHNATTDSTGRATFRPLMQGRATFSVQAFKDGYSTGRDTRELAPADRGRPVGIELVLRKRGETVLHLTVIDHRRRGVPGVTVTAAHEGWIGDHDPDYRAITDGSGRATLVVRTGRYSGEQWFGTTLRIEASDQTDKSERLQTTQLRETISYDLPSLSRTIVMLPGGAASDATSGIPVRITVVDQEGQPLQGARVTVRSGSTSETREAWTNAEGLAILQATVITATQVDVEATKPNYSSERARFRVDERLRGKGAFIEAPLTLYRQRASEGEAQIQVTVSNAKNGAAVADARVRLVPLADTNVPSSSGVTAADGKVTLTSRAAGLHQLTVSQEYFEPDQSEVTLDRKNATLPVELTERTTREVIETSVEVYVTAADQRDARGKPAPIPGARVIVGKLSVGTDANGKAVVRVPSEIGALIQVEAADYKPATLSVPGSRYVALAMSDMVRRVQLEPADPSESSPIELVVEVLDAADRQPIGSASVKVLLRTGMIVAGFANGVPTNQTFATDSQGKATIVMRADLAKAARQGLEVEVTAAGYAPSRTSVGADRLRPSREPVGYSVYLDDLLAAELAALSSEIAKLEALKEEIGKLAAAADQEEAKAAEAAAGSRRDEMRGIHWESDLIDYNKIELRVKYCTHLLRKIQQVGIDGVRRTTEVTTLLDAARQQAAACSSAAMAAQIELNLGQAIALTTELGELAPREAEAWLPRMTVLDDGERELRKEAARLEAALKEVRAALGRARQRGENRQSQQGALTRGWDRAHAMLFGIRGRRGLKAAHQASLQSLTARLEAVATPMTLPQWEKRDWEADLAAQLAHVKQWLGKYGQPPCDEVRTQVPLVVKELGDRWVALVYVLYLNRGLPEQAAACRKRALAALVTPTPAPPPPSIGAGVQPAADAVEVPDLSGVAMYSIAGVLWSRGLSFGGVQGGGNPDDPALAFKYKAQDPPPGTKVARGSAVTILLWQGPIAKPTTTAAAGPTPTPVPTSTPGPRRGVPPVVGKTLEEAMAALEAVGLRVGGITRGGKAPIPEMAGRIYFQSPGPGSPLPADGAVALKQYDRFEPTSSTQVALPSGNFAGRWGSRNNPGLQLSLGFKGIQWPGVVTIRDQAGSYVVDLGLADLGTMPARLQNGKLVFQGDLDWSAEMGKAEGTYATRFVFELRPESGGRLGFWWEEKKLDSSPGPGGNVAPQDAGPLERIN